MLCVRILNRIAHVKKFSYTQTYSISLQKARKNTNLSLNPIRNPDTHDALLMITYHDFSTHFFCIPKNINFCKIHIWNPYTHWSGKASKNTSKKVFQGAPDLSLLQQLQCVWVAKNVKAYNRTHMQWHQSAPCAPPRSSLPIHFSLALFFLTFFVEAHEISTFDDGSHARCQKKDVLSGADLIHRYTFTLFYLFFGRRARELRPRRDFWTLTPYPLREVSSGRAPPPPSK